MIKQIDADCIDTVCISLLFQCVRLFVYLLSYQRFVWYTMLKYLVLYFIEYNYDVAHS